MQQGPEEGSVGNESPPTRTPPEGQEGPEKGSGRKEAPSLLIYFLYLPQNISFVWSVELHISLDKQSILHLSISQNFLFEWLVMSLDAG